MQNVIIYLKHTCPYCIAAKKLLDDKGVPYQEHDVTTMSDDRLEQLALQTNHYRTVPKIFIGDTFIGGYDNLNQLHKDGKLDGLLGV